MSTNSNDQGRAYEYAWINTLYNALHEIRNTRIVNNSSLDANKRAWMVMSDEMQEMFEISADSAVDTILELEPLMSENDGDELLLELVQNKHSTRSVQEASETMLIFVIMGGQWMDGFFGELSVRAVNSPPPSCYKDSIEQVAPAMPRARHEPN